MSTALKFYLTSIVIYWIYLIIVSKIIKSQLKKEGLITPKSNIIEKTKNWFETIALSVTPVGNLIIAAMVFIYIDELYDDVKKKSIQIETINAVNTVPYQNVAAKKKYLITG